MTKNNVWKVIAITVSVLFILLLIFNMWILSAGNQAIENENECAYNICEQYESYNYDYMNDICYCFQDNEVVKETYLK